MNNHNHYNTTNKERKVFLIALVAVIVVITVALGVNFCRGEDSFCTIYAMCKSYVVVRRAPSKHAMEVGYLENGDWAETDGTCSNGYVRVYGIGEYGEGWVYSGFITLEEPKAVNEQYVVCSNGRVACRRWMGGPKTENPWLKNGSNVFVFCEADGWMLTNCGYVRSEYLEVDPL